MITIKLEGMSALQAKLQGIEKEVRKASRLAINATARKVAEAENAEIARVFDRPTPRTAKAVKVFQFARYDNNLAAIVGVDDGGGGNRVNAKGFKGTIYPAKYLAAQVMGGSRVPKRFELALQKAGVMPSGMFAVMAKRSNALDQYGNLPASKIVQILQWFQAFPEAGYRTNMKGKSKADMAAAKGRYKKLKWGFAYFRGGRGTGLPDGIWERHYPEGQAEKSFIRPVLIYVSSSNYGVRFKFGEIARRVVDETFQPEFNRQLGQLLRG